MNDEEPKKFSVVRSPAFREIYSNLANPRINLFDCGLTFAYMTQSSGSSGLDTIIEEAHVAMAYGQAKFIAKLLSAIVQSYEDNFGPLASQDLPAEAHSGIQNTMNALKANNLKAGVKT